MTDSASAQRQHTFTSLYYSGHWGCFESKSGRGSTMNRTRRIRQALPEFIRAHNIRSIVDLGCGDFNWMSAIDLSGIDYLGLDIVPAIIERNRRMFPASNLRFEHFDAVSTVPPPADLLLCRDLFSHLSKADNEQAMKNICKSQYRYFIASQFVPFTGTKMRSLEEYDNENIETGYWYRCNLNLEPFRLPKPLFYIPEDEILKTLAIWPFGEVLNAHEPGREMGPQNPCLPEHFLQLKFIQKLMALPDVKAIHLYGSRARQDHHALSDIDIFLTVERHDSDLFKQIARIIDEADTHLSIDCNMYNDPERQVDAPMWKYRVPLYEKTPAEAAI